jgi:transcriptional regulator with XRE-family HTH domain
MSYEIEPFASALKAARQDKGLSQRALSALTGLTQAHISKIENGAVDLRLSNLIELARVLELEVVLVPRRAVPAVRSLARNWSRKGEAGGPGGFAEAAYRLDDEDA